MEAVRLAAGLDHLDAKLVTEDARVVEERLPPGEGMKVGAAHANAMHAHERLARRLNRRRAFGRDEAAWRFKSNLDHTYIGRPSFNAIQPRAIR